MRILLVNAVDTRNSIEVLFPHLGLAYIASHLRKRFPDITIRIICEKVEQAIRTFEPDILGISSVTQNYNLAKEYARIGKKYGLAVIVGGTHVSSLISTLSADMDIAVLGEGEETVAEIVEKFRTDNSGIEGCKGVDGIAYRDNGAIRLTSRRPEIDPLDTILFPARDLLPIPKRGIVHLFSSRGCPYRCQFCASTHFWDQLRFFSADYVIEEIERVVKDYHPITIGFYDDLFMASRKRLVEIVDRIRKRGYHRRIEFVLSGRSNLIDDEIAALMKKMNVVAVNLGLESGSEQTLAFLKGNSVSVETNAKAVETLHRHGINTHGTFVIGCPGETEEDIRKTETFVRKSKLSSFEVYLLTPFPGTPIWSLAEERGLVCNDMDWSRLAQESRKVDPDRVLMADLVSAETLYKYYMRLQKLKKRRRLHSRIVTAFRNPGRLIPAIEKNLATKVKWRMSC